VTEHSFLAARQHGRHPSAFVAESPMTNRVNTTMNAVKAAGG
jgi:hypothetical protein